MENPLRSGIEAPLVLVVNKTQKTCSVSKDITIKDYKSNKGYDRTIEEEVNKSSLNDTRVVRASDAQLDRSGIYYFRPSGIGDSWLVGTDETGKANAFKNGVKDCPPDLTIPSTLTDSNGNTKPVEIIGQHAFFACGWESEYGKTRKLTLTKQVKVIKFAGLGWMHDLEEFVIEEGSVLETIEQYGIHYIGYNPGQTESKRVTLTLPSTLHSFHEEGIFYCNLFNVIIYCGPHPLTNTTKLVEFASNPQVKVLSKYPSGEEIFGLTPDRNSQAEVREECRRMLGNQIQKTCDCSPAKRVSTLLLLFCLLV